MNPWKLLNLQPTCDRQQIEKAWRKLASIHHPDHGGNEDTFKQIRVAYEQALSWDHSKPIKIPITTSTSVAITLRTSEVLRSQYTTVEFEHKNQSLTCSVLVPEWETDWGNKKAILVRTNSINLMLTIYLENDDLEWNGKELIWRPTLELWPVLDSRYITVIWDQQEIKLPVDCYGHSMLLSQGYKTSTGDRLDIIVQPKYIWPKNDPC